MASLGIRSSALVLIGSALILVPLAAPLSADATVTGVVLGAVAFGLGLAGTGTGRGTLHLATLRALDRGLALAIVLAGAVFVSAGEGGAAVLLVATGMGVAIVSLATHYTHGVTRGG